MKKVKRTEEYEVDIADLEELIRDKYLTDLPENAKISISPQYHSYYDEQVFRGMKVNVEIIGE